MILKKFSSYVSEFVPEHNSGEVVTESQWYIPQAVRIRNILAAGQSLVNLRAGSNCFDQFSSDVDETQVDAINDFDDLADVHLKTSDFAEQMRSQSNFKASDVSKPVESGTDSQVKGGTGGENPPESGKA